MLIRGSALSSSVGGDDGSAPSVLRHEEQIEQEGIAKGDIVGLLCADDYYLPGAITKAVQALKRNPDATFSRWTSTA